MKAGSAGKSGRKNPKGWQAALLACLFAVSVNGQPQPPLGLTPVEPKLPSDGVVVIQVADSQGRPLMGALVVLRGHTTSERPQQILRSGASDASGRLRFADLPNGAYSAEARMAGFTLAPASMQNTQLQGVKALGQMQLVLHRIPVLTGRVVDERGTPLLSAQVQAFRLNRSGGEQSLQQAQGASTDDRGVYRLTVREPGRYWLMAFHMEPSFPRGSAPRSTGVVFYPNSPDLLSSLPADLSFDQPEATLDIALPRAARTEVAAGILSGPDARPCTRCRYSLQRVEGAFRYELTSGQTGSDAGFDTRGVPPGQYHILVQDEGNDGWWAVEAATLVEGRTTALTIQTQPPVSASGRVTLEDPPRETVEQARERPDGVIVQLNQAGNHFFAVRDGSGSRIELPLEQSDFTLGPLPPEKFRIEVFVQGANAYLAGMALQGRDLTSPILDFSQPGAWTNLELRVRFDPAETQFRLAVDAAASTAANTGAPAYRLVAVPDPESNPFGQYSESHCVSDGQCYSPPLPPGRYWVIVLPMANGDGLDLQDPEVRKKLAPWGREVTLAPGRNPQLDLTLAPEKAFAAL
jgi:hypothetical protein